MTTREDMLGQVSRDAAFRPLLEELLLRRGAVFAPMLTSLSKEDIPAYLSRFEHLYGVVRGMAGREAGDLDASLLRGLDFHTAEFLRRQVQFLRTGRYQATEADAVRRQVYLRDDVMDPYLDGLLLTYLAWPNQYRILRFYVEDFLTTGPSGTCLDVGPGHGYLSLLQMKACPDGELLAYDVSPHAVEYCRRLLASGGVPPDRFEISCRDFLSPEVKVPQPLGRATLAEVLEHVEAPARLLAKAVEAAEGGSVFFITTCINVEAIDHVYQFTCEDEVRALLGGCGLSVVRELVLPLGVGDSQGTCCANYAAVCRPSGSYPAPGEQR